MRLPIVLILTAIGCWAQGLAPSPFIGGGGGGGDIVGPGSATDGCIALFNGATGKSLKCGVGSIDASGNVTGLLSISLGGATNACDGTAGCIQYSQGTAPSTLPANTVMVYAPTAVTSYNQKLLAAAATGVRYETLSGSTLTPSILGTTGTAGSVVLSGGSPTFTGTPVLAVAAATSLALGGCSISSYDLCTTNAIFISDTATLAGYRVQADGTGLTIAGVGASIGISFTDGATYDTRRTTISQASNGVAQIGTTTKNALGSLLLTDITASGGFKSSASQTTVSGSTSGSAVFAQPFTGGAYKKVVIFLSALLGTASYTYPTAFSNTPSCFASGAVACGILTSTSTTAVTATGATSTGYIVLEGY